MQVSIRRKYWVILLLSVLFTTASHGGESLPDVNLRVATQFSKKSELGSAIDILTLQCFEGDCELITLVINNCVSLSGGNKVQTPFAYTNSTKSGDLYVHRVGNYLHVDQLGGPHGITRKFIFEFIPDRLMAINLKSFSGGYADNSVMLEKTITADLVPLKGKYQTMELDCPIELPGLYKHDD